jgi:chromosome segregation ATPase
MSLHILYGKNPERMTGMGLYMDRNKHRNLFKNKEPLKEPNQGIYIKNHVAEMIMEQKKVNQSLHQTQVKMKQHFYRQEGKNAGQWREMLTKLTALQQNNSMQDRRDAEMIRLLEQMEEKHTRMEKLLEDTQRTNKELSGKVNHLQLAQSDMTDHITSREQEDKDLRASLQEQSEWQDKIETKLTNQEEHQKAVMASLENQEALTEKLARQLDHVRSTLFERTSHLAEKIEENYRLTTAYITKLFTGSENQIAHFKMDRRQNKK